MFVIDNGDAIRGIAEVASKLDFTVHGTVAYVPAQLADGQLGGTEADLYASSADATMVTLITITNTDSVARTFTLYLKPNGGTSRAISPVSLDLGVGHTFYTDGRRMQVVDASGQIITSWSLAAVGITATAAELNILDGCTALYTELNLLDLSAQSVIAGELLVGTGSGTAAWQKTGVILTSPTINGTIATSGLTLPAHTSGAITIGANSIKFTNFQLIDKDGAYLAVRNLADDAFMYLQCKGAQFETFFAFSATAAYISAFNSTGAYFFFRARDSGASALQEVMRIGGAAIPFMSMPADTQVGFFGVSPTGQSAAYTPTNVTPDRAFDCDTVVVAELADVVATLIADLQLTGLIG